MPGSPRGRKRFSFEESLLTKLVLVCFFFFLFFFDYVRRVSASQNSARVGRSTSVFTNLPLALQRIKLDIGTSQLVSNSHTYLCTKKLRSFIDAQWRTCSSIVARSLCNWYVVRASVTWRTSYCTLIYPLLVVRSCSYFPSNATMIDGHFVLTSSIEFRLTSVITGEVNWAMSMSLVWRRVQL